jgi:hypothetical protein
MRIAAIICFVLSAGVISAWAAMGAHPVTHYQVPVEMEIEDEFGDKQKVTKMQDKFEFGMLPDKPWDGALTWILVLDGLGTALFVVDMMKRKKAAG